MDNKQLQTLESLDKVLLANSKIRKQELCDRLSCSQQSLLNHLSSLTEMGLNLKHDPEWVQRIGNTDELDVGKITKHLKGAQINKPVHYFFSTESTNLLARQDKTSSIYLANHQTTGRGRQGKHWLTPLGQSIALSINHQFNCALQDISGLNIAMGVAIINAAKKCGNSQLKLKWPNDVLADKGKVAGILIEASGNNQNCSVTIGIGINWQVRETLLNKIQQACTNIEISDRSRTDFIIILIQEIEKTLSDFSNNKLKNILPQWQRSDAYSNQDITILQSNHSYQGRYVGIDTKGCLQIRIKGTTKTLASGVVSVRKICNSKE